MVSTDGHRLSKFGKAMAKGPKLASGVLIRAKGWPRLDGLSKAGGRLRHRDSSRVLRAASRRRDPDGEAGRRSVSALRAVIPKENDKILVIEREVLLDALREFPSSLPTRPGNPAHPRERLACYRGRQPGSWQRPGEAGCEYKGSSLQIGFNARYFIDLLTEMGSKNIRLELARTSIRR